MIVGRFFGAALMAVGILTVLACGLCTLAVCFISQRDIPGAMVIGGVPMVIGWCIFCFGRWVGGYGKKAESSQRPYDDTTGKNPSNRSDPP